MDRKQWYLEMSPCSLMINCGVSDMTGVGSGTVVTLLDEQVGVCKSSGI